MNKVSQYGGHHPNTAALKNVLAAQGVTDPHTGKPFTEAMLLGIGGGLGAGYILWEFKAHGSATIVMGFSNRWNYGTERMTTLCQRLGVKATVQETSGRKAADANLQAAMDKGTPVVAWVDKAHMPHQQLPEALQGRSIHMVGVYGFDNGDVLVDDLADELFRVPVDVFAAGRGRIGSDKNRLILIEPPAKTDLKAAITAGINDHLEHLGRDSESFSLPVYKKWAKLMTDTKNKKGWPVVFKSRKGLYDTVRSIYEGITHDGTDGCGLRGMYADFLEEASPVVGKPALKEAAAMYRAAAKQWVELAQSALPDSVPAFKETKALMVKHRDLYKHHKLDEMRQVSDKLEKFQAELNPKFPMQENEVEALFSILQDKLTAVYEAEVSALEALRRAI
jgi:hypothetical protein